MIVAVPTPTAVMVTSREFSCSVPNFAIVGADDSAENLSCESVSLIWASRTIFFESALPVPLQGQIDGRDHLRYLRCSAGRSCRIGRIGRIGRRRRIGRRGVLSWRPRRSRRSWRTRGPRARHHGDGKGHCD